MLITKGDPGSPEWIEGMIEDRAYRKLDRAAGRRPPAPRSHSMPDPNAGPLLGPPHSNMLFNPAARLDISRTRDTDDPPDYNMYKTFSTPSYNPPTRSKSGVPPDLDTLNIQNFLLRLLMEKGMI